MSLCFCEKCNKQLDESQLRIKEYYHPAAECSGTLIEMNITKVYSTLVSLARRLSNEKYDGHGFDFNRENDVWHQLDIARYQIKAECKAEIGKMLLDILKEPA